jgi:D-alanine-D-alanine ligase
MAHCDVAILVDETAGAFGLSGRFLPNSGTLENQVLRALSRRYEHVEVVPFLANVVDTIATLRTLRPRVVFNLTECVNDDRTLDAAIGGLLDLLKIRYTGSGQEGLQLARDKALSKSIASRLGIQVPRSYAPNGHSSYAARQLEFPLIVKPRYEDGSEGIHKHSVVRGWKGMRERVQAIRKQFKGPAVCEEFISGRDLYVSLLGNPPEVLPPIELVVSKHISAPRIATYRLKHNASYRAKWRTQYRQAHLDKRTMESLIEASRKIFHALKLRDYARLDFRLKDDNTLYFIEANPNPDLDRNDVLGYAGRYVGLTYDGLLQQIVECARKR